MSRDTYRRCIRMYLDTAFSVNIHHFTKVAKISVFSVVEFEFKSWLAKPNGYYIQIHEDGF